MNLLFFSNVLPSAVHPTRGPFNAALVRALSQEHQVTAVCPVSMVDRYSRWTPGSSVPFSAAQAISPDVITQYPTFFYPPKMLRSHYGEFLDWSVGRDLERTIRERAVDAVVAYWTHPDGEVAVRRAHRAGIPAIVMTGGSDVLLLARAGRRRRMILNVLRRADHVVTVSEQLRQQLVADGIPAPHISVVQRGIDHKLFSPGDRQAARERLSLPATSPLLLGVGRLVPVKGWELLIDACGCLRQQGVDFSCHILGGGPLRASLNARIAQQGLQSHVTIHGSRTHRELPDWYRAADLSLLTSHSEGIPNVLLESISCGTGFVATAVGGVSEIADPLHDRLVHNRNPQTFAAAILQQLTQARQPNPDPKPLRRFLPVSWEASARRLAEIVNNCQRGVEVAT